jgi:bis(5'-nucleosidyl)-tetraphosphatase
MREEKSFGTIALKKIEGIWYTFLVKNKSGNHWGFPKGHANEDESFQETAIRELEEETNLKFIKYLSENTLEEKYTFFRENQKIFKTVLYYLSLVEGKGNITSDEISDGKWVKVSEAKDLITYNASKEIAILVEQIIRAIPLR